MGGYFRLARALLLPAFLPNDRPAPLPACRIEPDVLFPSLPY